MAVRSSRATRVFPVRVVPQQQEHDWNPLWLYGREQQDFGRCQPTLFTQLVGKMQGHLDEMERTRLVLLDAYPMLDAAYSAGSGEVEGGGPQARKSGPGLRRSGGGGPGGLGRKMRINRLAHHQHLLSLDVSGFGPEELAVKLEGRKLTVLGKHERKEESSEDGCRAHDYRELHRELLLPDDTDLEAVACSLGHDGQLWVDAPRLAPAPDEKSAAGAGSIPIAVGRAGEAEPDDKKKEEKEAPPQQQQQQQQQAPAPPSAAEESKAPAPPQKKK